MIALRQDGRVTPGKSAWQEPQQDVCVVVLAGGRGTRLGGVDKAQLDVQGTTLLEYIAQALPESASLVVAGQARPLTRPVVFVAEERDFGGPVSGLAAALPAVDRQALVVIAVDSPFVARVVDDLVGALTDDVDGVVAVDSQGRRQPLASCWWTPALRRAVAEVKDPYGTSMRELLTHLRFREMQVSDDFLADVDTPEDLARLRARITGGGGDGI